MRWILFDYADTLAELAPSKHELVLKFVNAKFPYPDISLQQIREAYFSLENKLTRSSLQRDETINKKDFYLYANQLLLLELGIDHPDAGCELFDYFSNANTHWVLFKEVPFVLEKLKSMQFKIGLLSNFDSTLSKILERQGILKYFDAVHVSQDIGVEKPDPQFYLDFLKNHNLDVAELVYVGDNIRLDYVPMQAIGARVYLVDRYQFHKKNIATLVNLNDLFEKIEI